MRRRIFLAVSLFYFSILTAVPLKPVLGPATPEELAAGQALAEHLRSAMPDENSKFQGRLIVRAAGATREVPIVCRITVNQTNWETDYKTDADHLLIIHSTNHPNRYLYGGTALAKLSPLAPSNAVIALAGSDFSLADLGLEFLHWPVQRQLKGEMRLGQPCYVLESGNAQGGGIVRVKSYIDKDSGGLLIAEAFDKPGHLVKEFSLHGSSFKKINGRWHVEKMEMQNKKTGSHTELKFDLNQ